MQPELEETIYVDFITSSPTTGAAVDADSTPTCEVFEDAGDTAILTPLVTKRVGKTGNYRVPLACTAANGFESGKSYNTIVSATVGGVVAKMVLQTFQLRTNGADDLAASILTRATPAQVQTELGTYGALRPTVAARTLDVSAGGEAGIDWANVGAPTTAQNLSATTISTSQAVASVTNPVALTAAYDAAKLAAPVGAAMTLTAGERTTTAGVIWAVLTSALTTAGSIGKLIVDNLNAAISSAVGDTPGTTTLLSRIASALTITAGKVDINDKTGFSLIAAYDPAKTAAQVGSAMTLTAAYDAAKTAATQASVNTIDDFVDTEVGAIKTVTDKLDTALEVDGPVWRYTVNALEQAPVGGGGGATDWTSTERDQIRHRLGIDGTATAPGTGTPSLASQTTTNAIKAKTDQFVFASGDVKATLDFETVTVAVNNDKSGYSLTAAYDPAKTAAQAGSAMSLTAAYDKAKTAAQPGEAMTLTSAYDAAKTAASQASVDGVDNFVDTEVGAIKAVTDKLDTALEIDGAVYRYTINALEMAPAGGGGGGGDPWLTHLPGSYPAGTAGRIVGDSLDAPVSSRVAATIFSGMTSIGQWLGLIAGKQAGNVAARDEIRATGVGSGTYDEATDSQEAIRDRGDSAWLGTGGASANGNANYPNPARTVGPTTEPWPAKL